MWCVVYAGDGGEEKIEDFIKKVLPMSAYTRCFHLVQHKALKKQGILRDVAGKYLPGYVFIETDTPQTVHDILKKTPKRLLFSDDRFVSTVAEDEESLLNLIVDTNGEIGISVARASIDEADGKKKNEYLSGPLSKVADQVVYVNSHHRYARIGGNLIGNKEPLKLSFRFEGEEICRTESERNGIVCGM